ncbi:MAG: sigma-70 family RNA polymerase sigma factor [Planctomycetota bacterium]
MNFHATTTSMLLREYLATDDPASFALIDQRYRPIVQGLARRAGLGSEEAEDVAQETLIRVARSAKHFDSEKARLRSWLFAIARNCLIDAMKARQKRRGWRGDSAVHELAAEPEVNRWWDRECEAEVLRKAIEELRANTRTDERTIDAFVRFTLDQQPAESIARDLEITVDQVYVAKSRCLVKLRPIVKRLREIYELD